MNCKDKDCGAAPTLPFHLPARIIIREHEEIRIARSEISREMIR